MSALTLPRGGTSRLRMYERDPLSEGTSQQRRIACQPPSGGDPIIGADGVRTASVRGTPHPRGVS